MTPRTASRAAGVNEERPDAAALLLCARSMLNAVAADGLAAVIRRGVHWDALLAHAGRNRLMPIVHRHLGARDDVPDEVRARLRTAQTANLANALRLSGELRRSIGVLDAAGVPAVAYKGPPLAVRAYGDVALRTYSDLDLLVAADHASVAERVLAGDGYEAAYGFSPAQDRTFRAVDGDYPFHHPQTGVMVEVHTQVSSARFCVRLPTAELMARARPVAIGGGGVPALADDDLFLALCAHGAKHRWARLEWVTGAAALAVRAGLDLDAMVARGARIGGRRTVLLALHLAHEALGLPLSAGLATAIDGDEGIRRLADEARALWFRPAEDDETAANLRYNYHLRDGAADRLRYAAHWAFTPSPEDWAWLALPDTFAPAYRVLRPLRLALRYAPGRRR